MAVAFSTDNTEMLEVSSVVENEPSTEEIDMKFLEEEYEISQTVTWIAEHNLKRVALQFPDELLKHAATLCHKLEAISGSLVFILADTSYGSCCVDEVAADHYSADGIVHYGSSCLSVTSRLPVLYIFPKGTIDNVHCLNELKNLIPEADTQIVVFYDVQYHHAVDGITEALSSSYKNIVIPQLQIQGTSKDKNAVVHCGRIINIHKDATLSDYVMFYIGSEGLELTNLLMTFNKNVFYTYNPQTQRARKETINVNKMLMKRFFMIEKAKEANIVGIVAGTLGVANYLDIIDRLKQMLKRVGKKTYTFVVGKLNVPKLANFMEVDVYVLVACSQNSLLDSKEFYKPVVTPFEMEVACNRDWTGEYVTDFRQLLPGGNAYVALKDELSEEHADVSLITGGIRVMGSNVDDESSTAVVEKRPESMSITTVHAKSAEEFLHQRSWQGLEQKMGQTSVTKAVEGPKGIAMAYDNEPPV